MSGDGSRRSEPADLAAPTFLLPPVALRWLINLLYAVLLVVLALLPPHSGLSMWMIPDRLAHAVAYGGQACLLFWAAIGVLGRRAAAVAAFLGAAAFGLLTEGLQWFQPARSVEIGDVAANAVGAAVTCGLILVIRAMSARERDR